MDFREDPPGLDPPPVVLRTHPGLEVCGTMSLLELEEGSSMLGPQNSPEWKLGQGSALLDLDRGLKVRQEQSQGGGGPENLLSAPKRFHSLGGVLGLDLDLDQRCAWRKFWIGPG